MHTYHCKPISLCSSLLTDKKKKKGSTSQSVVEPATMPSLLKHLQNARAEDTGTRTLDDNVAKELRDRQTRTKQNGVVSRRSDLYSRQNADRRLLKHTTMGGNTTFTDHENLPTLEAAYSSFKETYPRYLETVTIDELRSEEYAHLQESGRVCLDYCGFGLFSQLQQMQHWESASFALADISVNLSSHALFGAAEEGTVEFDIRKRIMEYLNIQDTEYSMVFTASRGATFKLLADAYPFETCRQLITMYDYESESVGWMVQRAKEKGAKTANAYFKWPSLKICSTHLKKQLLARKRKKDIVKGLFVFPVQSRVSGTKYSYQWMSLAQQNKWHVLLDASALGPKDMDSLGLSLFRPDFIIASFYKVFGADPSGFGCLFIKNSTIQFIHDSSGAPASGIVRIIPFPTEWLLSESSDGHSEEGDQFQDLEGDALSGRGMAANHLASVVSSFSGPMRSGNKQLVSSEERARLYCFEEGGEEIEAENSSACEENENVSVGEVTRSPVFSDDGTDNLFCIDIGPSPLATVSRSSLSEEPFSGPIRNPVYDEESFTHVMDPNQSPLSDSREEPALLQEDRVGKRVVFCPLRDTTFHFTEDERQLSTIGSSEDLEVSRLSLNCKREQEVELLGPGDTPFIEGDNKLEGQLKSKGPEYSLKELDEGRLLFHTFESPSKHTEGSDLYNPVQGSKYERNVRAVGKRSGVIDAEKISGRNLETISEIDINSDSCIAYAHSQVTISPPEKVNERERQSPIPWNQKENAIRRETEGDYRLLGRRNADNFLLGDRLPIGSNDPDRLGFAGEIEFDDREVDSHLFQKGEGSSYLHHGDDDDDDDDDAFNDDDTIIEELWIEREPEVYCKCLDHADSLGLNKTSFRLRYLINWLINSLLQLRHPGSEKESYLVHIYGPQVRYDRGASVAFNLYDCHGKLLHPELVQMLADRSNISLGIGFLRNIRFSDNHMDAFGDIKRNTMTTWKIVNGHHDPRRMPSRIEVVTAALGILSNFEDVYRLWVFLARFLEADFVSREISRL